ncbi:MAG: hypothetical protein WD648_06240 [Planctomycetaceae bacterium]
MEGAEALKHDAERAVRFLGDKLDAGELIFQPGRLQEALDITPERSIVLVHWLLNAGFASTPEYQHPKLEEMLGGYGASKIYNIVPSTVVAEILRLDRPIDRVEKVIDLVRRHDRWWVVILGGAVATFAVTLANGCWELLARIVHFVRWILG